MNPYIELIRPVTSLMAGLAVIIGAAVAGTQTSSLFLYAFSAVFFLTGAGMVLNDYYDLEIDKINAPHRPLPSGRVSQKNALFYSLSLFAVGLLFSALLNIYCLALGLLNCFLEFLYSKNFKRTFLFGNIIVSWLAASTFIFGALLTFDFRIVGIMSLLAFLSNMGREIFKCVEDTKGDRKLKLDTLPIAIGIDSAKQVARGLIASAVILSPLPYLSGLLNMTYLRIVSIGDILFLYSLSQEPTKTKRTTKLAMLIVLLAFLFGKFF